MTTLWDKFQAAVDWVNSEASAIKVQETARPNQAAINLLWFDDVSYSVPLAGTDITGQSWVNLVFKATDIGVGAKVKFCVYGYHSDLGACLLTTHEVEGMAKRIDGGTPIGIELAYAFPAIDVRGWEQVSVTVYSITPGPEVGSIGAYGNVYIMNYNTAAAGA